TIIIEGLLRNIEAHQDEAHPDYLAQLSMKFEEFQEAYYQAFPPNQFYGADHHEAEVELVEVVEMDEVEYNPQPQPMPQPAPQPMRSQQPYEPKPFPQEPQMPQQPQMTQQPYQQPRVDEALSRRKAENLSKAFTINDKYRFGQALFYGNNELMNEQIKAAQNFNNYQQAYDLFVSGNNWDPENPLVKEFMAIVSRHFQQS
ncbi:MAG: hypothetical protein K2N16_01915, partial [Muribaculaceae bacterium]|nr:hypothetical protein [Muribaculaceae bacterium]